MMETIQQIRNAHRKVVFKTVYTNKTVEDSEGNQKTIKVRGHERISDLSLNEFARQNGVMEIVKAAHKEARKPRSEVKMLRTRAATAANRAARKKRASGSKKEAVVVVAAKG